MQPRSTDTHNRILEAAARLFSQQGYDATGVAELCTAAGVSKGAFYHHFDSKQAVFLALLEAWLKRLDDAFDAARLETGDVPQAVVRMADLAGGFLQSADIDLSIILEFWMQAYRDKVVWQTAIAPYRRYQAYFASLIEVGVSEGSLRQVEADLAARTLVALALGLLLQAMFEPQATDWSQAARHSMGLLMNGLRSKP